jgi:hypothetical protein
MLCLFHQSMLGMNVQGQMWELSLPEKGQVHT